MKFIMKHGKTEKDIHNLRQEIEVIHSFIHFLTVFTLFEAVFADCCGFLVVRNFEKRWILILSRLLLFVAWMSIFFTNVKSVLSL